MPSRQSFSAEDYLKAIYEIEREQGRPWATTSMLAQVLEVSPASVTEMLKRLASLDPPLVERRPYRGARLSSAGERAALRVVRTHRLVERFLTEALGYRWDEVHVEAHRLEHAVSAKLGDRIADYLGQPETDPHGDLIPGKDGTVAQRTEFPLASLPQGRLALVTRVRSHDSSLLIHLAEIGIYPDVMLEVLDAAMPLEDGPLTVRIAGRDEIVGRAVAGQVFVSCSEPHAAPQGRREMKP